MNRKANTLPLYCTQIDELFAEIAEEQGGEPDEVKETVLAHVGEAWQ